MAQEGAPKLRKGGSLAEGKEEERRVSEEVRFSEEVYVYIMGGCRATSGVGQG